MKEGDRAGTEIPDVQAFSAALIAATGLEFGDNGRSYSPKGVVTKTKANLLIIGNPYHADAEPGQQYRVINEEDGVIVLEPIAAEQAAQEPVAA